MSYLSLLVLIPLAGLFLKSATISWAEFWATVTDPEVVASYKLTFGASLVAATINAFFGLIVAWTLVRYSFFGKKLVDADGRSAVRHADGRFGHRPGAALFVSTAGSAAGSRRYGIEVAYSRWASWWRCPSSACRSWCAPCSRRWKTWTWRSRRRPPAWRDAAGRRSSASFLPTILPALLTGFALAFARALGEYGSVMFISSKWEKVMPMLIYHEAGAVSLRRSGGHRRGHARGVVRRVVVHQFDRNGGAGGMRREKGLGIGD